MDLIKRVSPLRLAAMTTCLLGLLLLLPIANATGLSASFTLATGFIPPFAISYNETTFDIEGLTGEIVAGALKAGGLEKHVRIAWLPWKRAQILAQSDKNTLIFPLTRTAEREPLYKWIALLLTVPCSAYAIDPNVRMSSTQELAELNVGVQAGSPAEAEIRKLIGPGKKGKMMPIDNESANYKKLLLGRIDAWVTQDVAAAYVAKYAAPGEQSAAPPLIKGYTLFDQPIWLGANKETGEDDIARIRAALEQFKKSADFRRILQKYGAAMPQ